MKLQDQVCSLELSKHLKDLGVRQESYFVWIDKFPMFNENGPVLKIHEIVQEWGDKFLTGPVRTAVATQTYSAFTVAELGEMLPQYFESWRFSDTKKKDKDRWECAGHEEGNPTPPFDGVTEADARAKMLIYLIENKLIPAPGKE